MDGVVRRNQAVVAKHERQPATGDPVNGFGGGSQGRFQKALFMIRIRQQACVVFAEEPITVERNAVVGPIPKWARDDAQQVHGAPDCG